MKSKQQLSSLLLPFFDVKRAFEVRCSKKDCFKGAQFIEKSFRIKNSLDIKEHSLDIP